MGRTLALMLAAGVLASAWLAGAAPTGAQLPPFPTTTTPPTTAAPPTPTVTTAPRPVSTTIAPPAVSTTRRRPASSTTRPSTTTSTLSTIPPVAGTGTTVTSVVDPALSRTTGQGDMPAWTVALFLAGVLGTAGILGAQFIRTRPPRMR